MGLLPRWEELNCALGGAAVIGLHNYSRGVPVYSRLPALIIATAAGYLIGGQIADFRQRRIAEKNLYIQEYVRAHPEFFPETVPKKYKDVLYDWNPMR